MKISGILIELASRLVLAETNRLLLKILIFKSLILE